MKFYVTAKFLSLLLISSATNRTGAASATTINAPATNAIEACRTSFIESSPFFNWYTERKSHCSYKKPEGSEFQGICQRREVDGVHLLPWYHQYECRKPVPVFETATSPTSTDSAMAMQESKNSRLRRTLGRPPNQT
ncbi:hypothetical protein F5878DRAFT_24486 [Lentinula raphanica]|uniref:Secreted protein n=1 Tax=Lentinula raphanica TaxID=153919 RepID=A0AA38NX55_9AGAR|nr:hypothetical protein F5878DRAFT_24486 [Lentinula raphanica]